MILLVYFCLCFWFFCGRESPGEASGASGKAAAVVTAFWQCVSGFGRIILVSGNVGIGKSLGSPSSAFVIGVFCWSLGSLFVLLNSVFFLHIRPRPRFIFRSS